MLPLASQFEAYVRQLTGRAVSWGEPLRTALPGYLRQCYAPHCVKVDGQDWLAVLLKPKEPPPPLTLYKQLSQLTARAETRYAGTCLVAGHLSPYMRGRLVELGQPFVIPGRQLFWPALGSAETTQRTRRLPPEAVKQLSPAAQQLLIALLLGRLPTPTTVSDAAQALGYTAMSVSRAIKALEGNGLIESYARGRERAFALSDAPRATWERALPMLRTPVLRSIRILRSALPAWVATQAGESALAALTDLGAPQDAVFAATSRIWTKRATDVAEIPTPDEGTCVVELWRYAPEATAMQDHADPLSLYLSLHTQADERVQLALEALMETLTW